MTLTELVREAWGNAEEKGFHDGRSGGRDDTLIRLCLIHTEASEAAEVVKKKWTFPPTPEVAEAFADELADILIRVGDLAGCTGVDIAEAVAKKMERNRLRPRMYGTPFEGADVGTAHGC